eukprot:m.65442 g.65442  ORF g.65442 m.65442 type:complete len:420 (+) comp12056_c0_seq4:339-1598(+)
MRATFHSLAVQNDSAPLLCPGGNAAHVLTGRVSALLAEKYDVTLLTSFGTEAQDLNTAIKAHEGIEVSHTWPEQPSPLKGKPAAVVSDPSLCIPDADIILFLLPAFAHESYLQAFKPHLGKKDVLLGTMPCQGGFDICVHSVLPDLMDKVSLFGLETLPWACRISKPGQVVEVLGTKKEVDMCVEPTSRSEEIRDVCQELIGPTPSLHLTGSFLGLTLMNINSVWHPTITFGRFRGWDGVTPFEEPPLFYEGVDDFTADMLCNISTEIQEVKHKINEEYPDIDLSAVVHVTDWIKRAYQGQISDTTSLGSCIRTNSAYKGLTHAMKKVEGGYVPNFDYRYTSEDIPMGLVVTRGIAQLCDVPTPHLDKVLNWFEEHVPKSFLVEGKLTGTDIATTRCPQRYGYTDLRQFLVASRLVSAE